MHLVEIDAIHFETDERLFEFPSQALRIADLNRERITVRRICNQPAFGEDIGPAAARDRRQRFGDNLLGVTEAVDRRRIDPIHAPIHRVADGRDRGRVVLLAPTDGPVSADRPGSKPDTRCVHIGQAKLVHRKYRLSTMISSLMSSSSFEDTLYSDQSDAWAVEFESPALT
jgi:hypothetical protein